jgi:hypothetical protein
LSAWFSAVKRNSIWQMNLGPQGSILLISIVCGGLWDCPDEHNASEHGNEEDDARWEGFEDIKFGLSI